MLAGNDMQRIRKNVRRTVSDVASIAVVIYVAWCICFYMFPPQYPKCQRYNDELNGGVKLIGKTKYNVQMCGTGGDENSNSDEIELKVLDERGELLAKRHFTVHWMANFHEPLEYQEDKIIYYDFSTHNNFKKTIDMPPSKFEWLRARVPLLN
jgi:hypothetical protein